MIKDLHGGGGQKLKLHMKRMKRQVFSFFFILLPQKKTKKIYELPDKKFSLKGWGDFSGKYKPMNP